MVKKLREVYAVGTVARDLVDPKTQGIMKRDSGVSDIKEEKRTSHVMCAVTKAVYNPGCTYGVPASSSEKRVRLQV